MRKVIVFVNVTADGYLSGPNGELDWMLPDPEMNTNLTNELRERADTILAGRKAHFALDGVFRAQAADPSSPAELVDFANWMVKTPKVVFSRTQPELDENSRYATEDLATEIANLKAQEGKDLVIFGGVETVQQLVQQGLVDEYWIKYYPVALGSGHPLFTDLKERADLKLIKSEAHASGILTLRYAAA